MSAQLDLTLDKKAMAAQRTAVLAVMLDYRYYTLAELVEAVYLRFGVVASEAGTSARVRDMRKRQYGGYTVDRRIRHGRVREYAILRPAPLG